MMPAIEKKVELSYQSPEVLMLFAYKSFILVSTTSKSIIKDNKKILSG